MQCQDAFKAELCREERSPRNRCLSLLRNKISISTRNDIAAKKNESKLVRQTV